RGYHQFLEILDSGRIAIAALSTGLAQGCLDESLRYTGQREAFGHHLAEYQAISFTLADMATRVHTARLGYYDAAARRDAGQPFRKQAAMAKLHASDVAVRNARDATQLHGGYGFMNEFPVARMWRDAKILEIGEGTNEVQHMVIARELGVG
ncbi:MAG: acyl-CoA dehydrogenase family protein, partial [Terriglobales bacterium]